MEGGREGERDVGTISGLSVLRIINEPTAAAKAYGRWRENEREKESKRERGREGEGERGREGGGFVQQGRRPMFALSASYFNASWWIGGFVHLREREGESERERGGERESGREICEGWASGPLLRCLR